MAEAQILIMYVTFFLVVAILGSLVPAEAAVDVAGGEAPGPFPVLDDSNLSLLNYLIFGFELVTYFLFLQGLTVVGVPSAISLIISIVFNIAMVYTVVRLVRGGG